MARFLRKALLRMRAPTGDIVTILPCANHFLASCRPEISAARFEYRGDAEPADLKPFLPYAGIIFV